MPPADDVDLGAVASSTPGMVGADLKNLVTRPRSWRQDRHVDGTLDAPGREEPSKPRANHDDVMAASGHILRALAHA